MVYTPDGIHVHCVPQPDRRVSYVTPAYTQVTRGLCVYSISWLLSLCVCRPYDGSTPSPLYIEQHQYTTQPLPYKKYYAAENKVYSQSTQNICMTFVQCWTNVEDVGPALYKCYTNVLC